MIFNFFFFQLNFEVCSRSKGCCDETNLMSDDEALVSLVSLLDEEMMKKQADYA